VLAATLVAQPEVLLLDEPTNHLDLPTIEWLERHLAAYRGGLVLISHDRRFQERLTRGMLWVDRGVLRRNRSAGFSGFDAWAEQVLADEATSRAKFDKRLVEETRWSREGISARRTRNQGRLRRLHAMRAERAEQVKRVGQVALVSERGEASGKLVIEATGLTKAYGDVVVVQDFSTRVLRGDRVGIIGPNGAGKTTLVRMLTGDLEPDTGTVRTGTRLTPVYLDQQRSKLDPKRTLWDTLAEKGTDQVLLQGKPRHVLGYLKDYLFAPEQARSPVGSLSGGERNRLLLAWAMLRPSNLLVLDEPTNDLDMETLDVLQETLGSYDGTLLVVSHDRDFLDRVVTQTLAFEGDGVIVEYAGGYTDAIEKQRALASAAVAAAKAPQQNRRGRQKKKLSFNEKRDLEALPGQIATAEAEIARLERVLADANAYSRDPKGFNAAISGLDGARAALAKLEERWLKLEELRESLDGQ
jgi:ATP-binding cassette subfamily F protein uup